MDLNLYIETFKNEGTPLVRTDFSNDAAWQTIVAAVTKPADFDNSDPDEDGYAPHIVIVDDRALAGATGSALGETLTASNDTCGYVLLADARSMSEALAAGEVTLDYVDLSVSDPEYAELFDSFMGRTFRCAINEVALIEANLSISNMDFSEFADGTDSDGVFRGFGDQ